MSAIGDCSTTIFQQPTDCDKLLSNQCKKNRPQARARTHLKPITHRTLAQAAILFLMKKAFHDTGIEFLRAELLSGLTRATIAGKAKDDQKRKRNCLEARKAHDTILRFLPQTPLSQEEQGEVESKLAELKAILRRLGENV
jgi:hypothetical protein